MNTTMHIVIISTHFPPRKGGVETSNVQYLEAIERARTIEGSVLTYTCRERPHRLEEFENSKILGIEISEKCYEKILDHEILLKLNSPLARLRHFLLHLFLILKGSWFYRRDMKTADHILANGALLETVPSAILALLFRKKFSIRWRATIHDFLTTPILRNVLLLCFNRAEFILVNDEDIQERIRKSLKRDAGKVIVRKNPVDTNLFYPIDIETSRNKLHIDSHKFVVLFAALMNWTTYSDILLSVARNILSSRSDFYFIFIGNGELTSECEKLKETYPINIRLEKTLISQEILNLYINAANIVFAKAGVNYPSRLALESISTGTPVMIPNQPITGDLQRDNHHQQLSLNLPNNMINIVDVEMDAIKSFLTSKSKEIAKLKNDDQFRSDCRSFVSGAYSCEPLLDEELNLLFH